MRQCKLSVKKVILKDFDISRISIIAIYFILISVQLLAIDVALQYTEITDDWEGYKPYGTATVEKMTKPPKGTWKLPKIQSKMPLYMMIKIGDAERLAVLDITKPDDDFYTRLYFDTNGNADLLDDPPVDGTMKDRKRYYTTFPTIKTTGTIKGSSIPYNFISSIQSYRGSPFKEDLKESEIKYNIRFSIRTSSCYTGEILLGDKKYRVFLNDQNANGYFNDMLKLPPNIIMSGGGVYYTGDRLYLSPGQEVRYEDAFICSPRMILDGILYDMSVSPSGNSLTLTPTKGELVLLRFPYQVKDILIQGEEDCSKSVLVRGSEKEIRIPAGKYRLLGYSLDKQDEKGNLWTITARATAESPWVEVNASEGTTLPLGEPYQPTAYVEKWEIQRIAFNNSDQIDFECRIEGAGKEVVKYLSGPVQKESSIKMSSKYPDRPAEPTYKIMKSNGKVIQEGNFEYG